MKPKVSVIMPAYNAALYIKEAIQSILDQTFSDFELIIINDGSTDGTLSVIQSFSDKRIRLINNEKNLGIIASRNVGLDAATGEYIAKMDADDISLPTRFETQVSFLDAHPTVAVLASKLAIMDEKGRLSTIWPEDYFITSTAQIKATLPRTNCIGQPTVMMRAEIVKGIRYNQNYQFNEDWGLWLDVLARNGVIAKLDQVLLHYRVHATSTTVTENARNVALKTIKFRAKYIAQNSFKKNRIVFSVFKGLVPDVVKLVTPAFVLRFLKLLKLNFAELASTYFNTKRQFRNLEGKVSHLFFFPFYHFGGAEKVHNAILETVADKKALVFITDSSSNTTFLTSFKASARVMEVKALLQFGPSYRWLRNRVKKLCEQNPDVILFGCNSKFYYDLLPAVPAGIRSIDLTHAFVHEYEDGPEKWSLPVVNRIDTRVVISTNTKGDFKRLYAKNHVDLSMLERIVCISNYVNIPSYVEKDLSGLLHVLYVGRGSFEKRIHLISGAARLCALKNLQVMFHFVGDTGSYIPETDKIYCNIHGEIHDEKAVNNLYAQSHALVIASSREGFPMVIMEAMAHAVIPIATNVGGIPTHILPNANGLLIEENVEKKIMSAIVRNVEMLLNDKPRMHALSKAAYAYASVHFKKDVFFNSYRKLLS